MSKGGKIRKLKIILSKSKHYFSRKVTDNFFNEDPKIKKYSAFP